MTTIKLTGCTGEQFAKRMFYLAWKACGGAVGMGVLQDRGPNVSEDDVWQRIVDGGEYAMPTSEQGYAYGDYVFGRMMKLGVKYADDSITVDESRVFRYDYQGFADLYPDYGSLIDAAKKSLAKANIVVETA